jgi:hypothetical protein
VNNFYAPFFTEIRHSVYCGIRLKPSFSVQISVPVARYVKYLEQSFEWKTNLGNSSSIANQIKKFLTSLFALLEE